ncbi:MAG: VTT domain-containing protein [Anaerolineae bacterium]|nr:VTT domain-containing protein [Anaerolineae bacterium]
MVNNHLAEETSSPSTKKIKSDPWVTGSLILAGLVLLWRFWSPLVALLAVVSDREAVSTTLGQFGLAGPLLLGLVLVLQVVVAAIPGHILMISGGYVYGFGTAFCINLVATVGGSQATFLLARWAGRPVVERLAPANVLDKWNTLSAQKGLIFFLIAFMLPVFPADVMNYVAGMSSMSGGRFFIANLFGRLPGVVVLTAIGAYGFELSGWTWLIALGAAAVTYLVWRYGLVNQHQPMAVKKELA